MTLHSFSSRTKILVGFLGVFLAGGVTYAVINYSECFPNGCSIYQSQANGWASPKTTTTKDIMTPEGCRRITRTNAVTDTYFIPTKTLAEWVSFRDNPPSGVSIGTCGINGVCGASKGTCSAGTLSNYNPGSCGGNATWKCLGSNGGTTASCTYYNTPSPNMGNVCTYPCYWKRAASWHNRPASLGGTSGGGIWCNPTVTAPMPPVDWGVDWPILQYYCSGPKPTSANGINTVLIYYNNCEDYPQLDQTRCDVMCRTTVRGRVQCDGSCGGPWQ